MPYAIKKIINNIILYNFILKSKINTNYKNNNQLSLLFIIDLGLQTVVYGKLVNLSAPIWFFIYFSGRAKPLPPFIEN